MIPYNVVELTIPYKAYSPLYCRDSLVAIHSGGEGGGGGVWSRRPEAYTIA